MALLAFLAWLKASPETFNSTPWIVGFALLIGTALLLPIMHAFVTVRRTRVIVTASQLKWRDLVDWHSMEWPPAVFHLHIAGLGVFREASLRVAGEGRSAYWMSLGLWEVSDVTDLLQSGAVPLPRSTTYGEGQAVRRVVPKASRHLFRFVVAYSALIALVTLTSSVLGILSNR